MRTHRVDATIFGATSLLALALGGVTPEQIDVPGRVAADEPDTLVGIWLSADRTVRLHLAADGTYRGSVAGRQRAAKGTYRAEGADGLVLRDETGLRTPVTIAEDGLKMAGHRLFRV